MKQLILIITLVIPLPHLFSQTVSVTRVDINRAIQNDLVKATHSEFDSGFVDDVFDYNTKSYALAAKGDPIVITLEFSYAENFQKSGVVLSSSAAKWSLELANSITDLDNKTGSYICLVSQKDIYCQGCIDSVGFPLTAKKCMRLSITPNSATDRVQLNEWHIDIPLIIYSVFFDQPDIIDTLLAGQDEQWLVIGKDNMTELYCRIEPLSLTWESLQPSIAQVSDYGIVHGLDYGIATIRAKYGTLTASSNVRVIEGCDLTVCYIKRLPEMKYVAFSTSPETEGWPAVGQEVTWRAYVKNYSNDTLQNVYYRWTMRNKTTTGIIPVIYPHSLAFADLKETWNFNRDEITFDIDYPNQVTEGFETNNKLITFSDALSLHLYVEQSVYDYFHKYQHLLNAGTNNWEDWAQILQIKRWNTMFAAAKYPQCPNGVLDRIRLDSIIVVSDGTLPMNGGGKATNNPNQADSTADLQWGIPAKLLDGTFYKDLTSKNINNAFYFEGGLLHEIFHARYLIDTYGFDVSNSNNNIAIMENGVPVAGSYYMPYIEYSIVHYNDNFGIMGSTYEWIDEYSAVCLNRISGKRPICGNMSAPCNFGIFLNDLPTQNLLVIRDQYGNQLKQSSIQIYRATGIDHVWYGKYYDNIPDMSLTTNDIGEIALGNCPFSASGIVTNWYGLSDGTLILRAEHNGKVGYAFLESTHFNKEYWKGNNLLAFHEVQINMLDKPMDVRITSPGYGSYINRFDTLDFACTTSMSNIKKIDFYIDTILVHTDSTSGFSYKWIPSNLPAGTHTLRIMLTDTDSSAVFNEIVIHTTENWNISKVKTVIPAGPVDLCSNPDNTVYHTKGNAGMDYYEWSIVPQSAGIVNGIDSTITIDFDDSFTGTVKITVTGNNIYGTSQPSDTIFVNVHKCSSTEEPLAKEQVSFYPNPVNGILNIVIPGSGEDHHLIKIMNLNGQTLIMKETTNQTEQIDLSSFKGLYLIEIRNKTSISVDKLIVF